MQENYFLNHSVGLPFEGAEQHLKKHFYDPWQQLAEPWPHWLAHMEAFRTGLAKLINGQTQDICPQANLSSALTKLLFSLPVPRAEKNQILLSEEDFPSMGFVLQKATSLGYRLVYLPRGADLQDLNVWQDHLSRKTALCLITHVQSNNGKQLPVANISAICREHRCISIADVAQSIGLLSIDVKKWDVDFILGSCVKWLCGGPGAGFIWVNQRILPKCQPQDIGWFSHENPFEFDIHHFDYHNTALRFWGGTPAVMNHINAAFAIENVIVLGTEKIRSLNLAHLENIWQQIPEQFIVSPMAKHASSGTAILHFKEHQQLVKRTLTEANIAFDEREQGFRISPHFYTNDSETQFLIDVIKREVLR